MTIPPGEASGEIPVMRLFLLGGFRATVGDCAIDDARWRRRRVRHLIALIALAPRATIHREQVLELLWPDSAPTAAANNLYQTLHLARRTLDSALPGAGERLQLQGDMLSIASDAPLWIDVTQFERAAERARNGSDSDAWQEAIDLYAGDLLPQDRYEDWATDRRESLRAAWLALLLDYASQLHAAGQTDRALASLQQLVSAEPVHEEAHRLIMQIHAQSGNRQAALSQYNLLRRSLQRHLDAEPDAESQDLYGQIASRALPDKPAPAKRPIASTVSRPLTNIHSQPTSFVGRERELAEVHRLLNGQRLLTLTGPGGAGKTRLAVETATRLSKDFPDGVWMADLSSLKDPALVPQAVAATLGISQGPDQPLLDSIGRFLDHRHLLLLIDNCEHLIDACADLATHLLQRPSGSRLLATSREPLRVPGEVTWLVPSLTLPTHHGGASTEEVLASESARLFVQRARAVNPGLLLEGHDGDALAQICHRLDGIPLAIELASARIRALSIRQIADRLDDRFRLLASGNRTVPSRQQTLKGTIDWSHDLLDTRERTLFRRLSVFSGGFDLEAAEQVCSGENLDSIDVMDTLARLVDKSLVVAEASGPETRYRMLESIRDYATERLAESDEVEGTRRRHADVYLQLVEAAAPKLRTREQQMWIVRLDQEHDNIRAAIESFRRDACITEELRMVGALAWFWHRKGHFSEDRGRLQSALERSEGMSSPARLRALLGNGMLTLVHGELAEGSRCLQEAVTLALSLDAQIDLAVARLWLVWHTLFRHGPSEALPLARSAFEAFEDGTDRWHLGLSHMGLGFVTGALNQLDTARQHISDASAIFHELGDPWGIATSLTEMAHIAYRQNSPAALALAEDAVEVSREMGDGWQTVQALGLLVEIARSSDDLDRAAELGEEAISLAIEVGQPVNAAWVHRDLGHVAIRRDDIDAAAAHFTASYEIFREREYTLGIACCMVGMAMVASRQQRMAEAAMLLGHVQRLLETTSTSLNPADHDIAMRVKAETTTRLGADAFDRAFAVGQAAPAIPDLPSGADFAGDVRDHIPTSPEIRQKYAFP